MQSRSNRTWIPLAVVIAATLALAPRADAGGKNRIANVTFDDAGQETTIRIRGTATPTFTVYKLERPHRVVVDVAGATLGDAVKELQENGQTIPVGSWAVSQVAAYELDDGGALVRVVVTLARPGRYDVEAKDKDLIVKVVARDAAPEKIDAEDLAAAKTSAARAREESEQARAARAKAEKEAAKAKQGARALEEEAERAKKALADAQAAATRADRASKADRERAEKAVAAARVEAERTRKAAEQARADKERAEKAAVAAKAEAERTRAEADRALAQVAAMQADLEAAKKEAARRAAEAEAAKQEAARNKKDADTARAEAARHADVAKKEIGAARAEAGAAKAEADAAKAAAQRLEAEAKAAREDARRARAEAEAAQDAAEHAKKAAEQAKKADAKRLEAEARAARDEATRARAEAEAAKQAAADARRDADRAKAGAAKAEADAARAKAEAEARKRDAEAMRAEAEARKRDAELAKAEAAARTHDAASAKAEAAARKRDAETAKAEAAARKRDAETAKAEAAARTRDAEQARAEAAAQKRDAEAMRAEAERMLAESKARLRDAEREAKQARSSQEAALAAQKAAEAKEQAARVAATKAADERKAAREALAAAEAARAKGDRDAEQRIAAAEARLRAAEQARTAAEDKRRLAETAAADARAEAARRKDESDDAARARVAAESEKKAAQRAADEAETRAARAEKLRADEEAAAERAAQARADAIAAERAKASQKEIDARRAEARRLEKEAGAARAAREKEETQLAAIVVERQRAEKELAAARAARAEAESAAEAARRDARDAQARAARAREDADAAEARARSARVAAKPVPVPVPVPAPAPKPARPTKPAPAPTKKSIAVKDVSFQQDGSDSRVILALTGEAEPEVRTTGSRATLTFTGVTLPAKLERTLDVSKFDGAVERISSYRDPKDASRVHVVVDLATAATPRLERAGSTIRWIFASAPKKAVAAKTPKPARSSKTTVKSIPAPVVGGYGASSTPVTSKSVAQAGGRRKVYRGPTIDLDFKDADIHNLLRFLANIGRVSIVVPDDIKATVTVRLKRVPWDQALEVILASKGLWYRKEGNLYRVAPRKVLDAEDQAEAERIRAAVQAEVPEAEIFRLNYANADETQEKLAPLLSPKGKIEVDTRTNALIISDIRAHRRRIIDLAEQLDTQTPQIMIEARIVEARSTYSRDLGIQWGGSANMSQAGGNATGLIFPNSVGVAGGAEDRQTPTGGVAAPSDFAVNLPATVGTGTGGAIGISLGSVGGNFNLNLRLSAAEDTGTVRIISSPKITVLNNTEARISQGQSIPISVVSAQGTMTQFVPADLSLTVTPYVSQRDCSIAMDILVTKNEPDFVNTGARGDPTILTKEAQTRVLVADGETTVMGGITTRNTGLSYNKVPFFGDLPVVGWFFKRRRENDDRTELLIFITPKITNKAFLRCE